MPYVETPPHCRIAGNVQLGGNDLHGLRAVSCMDFNMTLSPVQYANIVFVFSEWKEQICALKLLNAPLRDLFTAKQLLGTYFEEENDCFTLVYNN